MSAIKVRGIHVTLGYLGEAEMPVPDEFVGEIARDACDVEGSRGVFDNAQMPTAQQVRNVSLVGRSLWIGLAKRQIATSACGFNDMLCVTWRQRLIWGEPVDTMKLCRRNQLHSHRFSLSAAGGRAMIVNAELRTSAMW